MCPFDVLLTFCLRRPGVLADTHMYDQMVLQRGSSPEDVATKLLQQPGLQGLAGPTISPVFTMADGKAEAQPSYFACVICVEKKKLYSSVKEIRQVGLG